VCDVTQRQIRTQLGSVATAAAKPPACHIHPTLPGKKMGRTQEDRGEEEYEKRKEEEREEMRGKKGSDNENGKRVGSSKGKGSRK